MATRAAEGPYRIVLTCQQIRIKCLLNQMAIHRVGMRHYGHNSRVWQRFKPWKVTPRSRAGPLPARAKAAGFGLLVWLCSPVAQERQREAAKAAGPAPRGLGDWSCWGWEMSPQTPLGVNDPWQGQGSGTKISSKLILPQTGS